ncbi:MAG TPA: TadE family protein [Mycobacteriales bacterium]|nr:TadE family protein [Mycobacteriales bacterium]
MTRLSHRRPVTDGDRGSGSLEFAVLSLAFLLLVFFMVQAALYYHARNVVKAEAEGTARAVRAYPTNAGGDVPVPSDPKIQSLARTAALDEWERLDNSGDTTSEPAVIGERVGLNQVRITIRANPIMIIPGIFGGNRLTITATAGGPFEVFKRSGEN